jgi:hypothetical protein
MLLALMPSLSIVINRLCYRSLWKLNCIGFLVGFMPIALVIGAYAWITGDDVVSLNDQYVYGFTAFLTSIGLAFFTSFIFGSFWTTVQWFGFTIYSRFRPIRLRYYEIKQS